MTVASKLLRLLSSSNSSTSLLSRWNSSAVSFLCPTRGRLIGSSFTSSFSTFDGKSRRNNGEEEERRRRKENSTREEVRRKNMLSASAFATGLLITFWAKSRWDEVEGAKPILHDYDQQQQSGGIRNRRDMDDFKVGADNGNLNIPKRSRREMFNFISDVVDKVKGTVVSIEVKDHSHVDFFTGAPHVASNGSGFIVSEDGLILTNAHVVASHPRASFSVRLSDGRTFTARIEDIDYESDLATIRINAKNLPTMPLGCSADTKLGEFVVAVGAPLTLTNTITSGIVSSTSRGASELGIQSNDINYIQTDAAITFGNSGGPLINLDGEAIGINSMKVTAGISFAIPIDHAKKFLARAEARKASGMKKGGRSYMGITILTVTEQIKRELETRGYKKVSQGVLVWQVVVGSPAYLAGIQPGDIIVRINGSDIRTSSELYEILETADKLNLHIQRGENLYSCVITPEYVAED